MRADTFREVIDFIRRIKAESGATHVRIGFHGGEPLLLKKSAMRDMCTQLRDEFGQDPILALMLQTNGVLVDAEWIKIFSEFHIRVGVSLDGPPALNDKTRITKKGKGTYHQTAKAWKLLLQAANAGEIKEPSILCVVAPEANGEMIFNHFVDDMRARSISFLLPDFTYDTIIFNKQVISQCTDFLLSVATAWMDRQETGISVRFIDEVIGKLISDELANDTSSRHNPYRQFSISSNGEICPDDVIRSFAPRFAATEQRAASATYNALAAHPAWTELARAAEKLPLECSTCVWKRVCGGGTLHHRYRKRNGFDNPSIYCEVYKKVNSYIAARLVASGIPADSIERRLVGN